MISIVINQKFLSYSVSTDTTNACHADSHTRQQQQMVAEQAGSEAESRGRKNL
ncbi:hypothetical protein O8Q47_003456 [Proteus mirabilis]|nr:hypothetical protein [Proteus mirabilis]